MDKIYLLKNKKVLIGPFTVEKLIERTVRPTDMVWYEGLTDWMQASKLPALSLAISELKNMDELYDLYSDPYEMQNIISKPEAASILKDMKRELNLLLNK